MTLLDVTLIAATLACGLVAGLLFGFAVVVMPGIRALDDRAFLRAFQVMDRVIQNNSPLFLAAWVGSVVLLLLAIALAVFAGLRGIDLGLLVVAGALYLLGVQLPTATINIPLNNALQAHNTTALSEQACAEARLAFEQRWNRWNRVRTFVASVTVVLLLVVLLRL